EHVNGRGRFADDLEVLRLLLQLERNAQRALHDLLPRHGQPQQRREGDGENLEAEMTERMIGHQALELALRARCIAGRRCRTRPRSRSRRASGLRFRSMLPSSASAISPRSSEITTATAS